MFLSILNFLHKQSESFEADSILVFTRWFVVFEMMFPVYVIKNIKAIFLTFNWTNIEQLLPQGQ